MTFKSDWIDDEALKYAEIKAQKVRSENLIKNSNYWNRLLEQLRIDITKINNHPVFQEDVGKEPIEMKKNSEGGYQIEKNKPLAVFININHLGEQVEVKVGRAKRTAESLRISSEKLSVVSDGNNVYLQKGSIRKFPPGPKFVIPKEASEYILKPVIESFRQAR